MTGIRSTWRPYAWLLIGLASALPVTQCSSPAVAAERTVSPERNPPGDIPDSQVFVTYASPQGFEIKVPEGWARQDLPDGAVFTDKYNRIELRKTSAAVLPTAETAKQGAAAELTQDGRAVTIRSIRNVKLRSGPAVEILYNSNSEPNPVTNKQIRLENERFLFYKNGSLVTLDLSAPQGADNVDVWKLMSESFRWG